MDRLQSLALSFLYGVAITGTLVAVLSVSELTPAHAQITVPGIYSPCSPYPTCPGACTRGGNLPGPTCFRNTGQMKCDCR